jgi:sodium/bile acid cotransporter 7
VLASLLNIGVIPLLVWPFSKLVGDDLGAGMLVAAATPCTLASAAVWTRRAGGNDAVAILVTLLTNGSCFLVMPFWLYLQTGESVSPSALTGTIYKLLFFVVLPMGLAQFARIHRSSAAWATENKPLVSTLALFGILSMVFLGSVNMTIRLQQSDSGFAWMAFLNSSLILTLVHCMIFWGGMGLAKTMRIPKAERIAVGFAGSQKTLMIGLSVAINLGVSILPIIVYHAVQLIIDTVFADWIREQHGDAALHEGKCR